MTVRSEFEKAINKLDGYARSGHLDEAVLAYMACRKKFPDKLKRIDWEALHPAVIFGHRDTVIALLGEGADVNAANDFKQTALMFAAKHEHLDICKILIKAGADVNTMDALGESILFSQCSSSHVVTDHEHIGILLLEAGAEANFVSKKSGLSCLQAAIKNGNAELTDALLDKGADIHYTHTLDARSKTVLHYAAEVNNQALVVRLINRGVNIFTPEDPRQWPLNIANSKGHAGVVIALVAAGGTSRKISNGLVCLNGHDYFEISIDRLKASVALGDATIMSRTLDQDLWLQTIPQRIKEACDWCGTHGFKNGIDVAMAVTASRMARMAIAEIGQNAIAHQRLAVPNS